MSGLLYREDMDAVRAWLTAWWNGTDMGRPALHILAEREKPLEDPPVVPKPDGAGPDGYTSASFEFRVNLARRTCAKRHYLGEAVPHVSPDLGANSLALYLGCPAVERPETVWFGPIIDDPAQAVFEVRRDNFYWDFTLRLTREMRRVCGGKCLLQFPDLIEGLDTLAAMRGTQKLLTDLIDRPQWVHRCMRLITDRYFQCYDVLYDRMRDEVGGSHFWAWAPGRMVKLQCDFSAMISPEMFGEFMVPVLTEMTERTSYSMYHWDGPGATAHHDHLLSIPNLDMIQWTPGAGAEPADHPRWWPMYHKTVDAGKKMLILGCGGIEGLAAMKREFGRKLKQFMIQMWIDSPEQAAEILQAAEV